MSNLKLISHISTNKQQQNLVLKSWHLKKCGLILKRRRGRTGSSGEKNHLLLSSMIPPQTLLADSERTSPPFINVQDQGINH